MTQDKAKKRLETVLAPNYVGVFVLKWDGTYEPYIFKEKSWKKFKLLMEAEDEALNEKAYRIAEK